jgi:MFS family permease
LVALVAANFAYLIAVTQRSSMVVASLDAAERFQTSAAQLASLAVLQLIVYAAMQIPVGIALDRFGPRIMLTCGAIIMASGQLVVAFAPSLEWAVAGRMLVGMGDAFTFISMIRMANNWMSGKAAALAQQWLATIGQLGQIISAIPFAIGLATIGWTSAFATLAGVGLVAATFVFIAAMDGPAGRVKSQSNLSQVVAALRKNVGRAPVKAAFWTHFLTQSPGNVFALLWGVPYLVEANEKSPAFASAMLTLFVITNASMGPVIGALTARYQDKRHYLVFGVGTAILTAWAVAILIPTNLPDIAVVILIFVLGLGGPVSMVAFDYSRTYVSNAELGAANGFINIGGFLAGLLMIGSIGLILDAARALNPGTGLYDPAHFKLALCVQFIVVGFGLWRFATANSRLRGQDH